MTGGAFYMATPILDLHLDPDPERAYCLFCHLDSALIYNVLAGSRSVGRYPICTICMGHDVADIGESL